ncbi:armadillo repeat-containing protein 6 [Pyrus ussuriensis x Pyrus communis]|uniref:Armadillo repeat-containing protein 6 n=1 Tax=Pyrus ussuriensis x Pyrus communis TaxID=2448454 RepID=A0A5N5IHM5_9ROSA|nr:armadillo repeat-containing protein 6 [Pyrus ussuriensis x Pyrus communis]
MDDLGMEPTEALEDGSVKDNPVLQCLDRLSQLNCSQNSQIEDELVDLLVKFTELCNSKGSGNAAIASRNGDIDILSNGFAIVVAAATSNEVIKELFMELMKIDELILRVLSVEREVSTESLYDAIQVYGYAQKFAKIEIVGALVESIRVGLSSSSLVSASIALKDVAVNIMAVVSVLSLRSPSISVVAIEAGAGELSLQAMQKFLAAQQM